MNSLTSTEKIISFFLFYLLTLGVIISYADRTGYELYYVREDSLIEWLTFVALLAGSLVCFRRFFILRGKKNKLFLLCVALLGGIFLFGAGEEISWGQRLLGIQSSEFFQQNNAQGEMNFHNLKFGDVKINKVIFGTGLGIVISLYLLILPVLYRKFDWWKKQVNRLAIPLPQSHHILFYLFLFLTVSCIQSGKRGEMLEFGGTVLFFLINLFPHNKENFK